MASEQFETTLPYMEWVKTVAPFGPEIINGAASGMRAHKITAGQLLPGVDAADMPVDLPAAYGLPVLREAIASRYGVSEAEVYPAQGTSGANYVLFASRLRPRDRVLLESPYYEPLLLALRALGAQVQSFQRREEDGWALEIHAIARQAREIGAAMIVLTSPHNPTGTITPDEDILALADEAGPGVLVVVDEAYREWLPGKVATTLGTARPNLAITSSLTKIFGLSGLRCGWVIGPEKVAHAAGRVYDHMAAVTPALTEWLGSRVLCDAGIAERIVTAAHETTAASRVHIEKALQENPRLHARLAPHVGLGVFKLDGYTDGRELADYLFTEHDLLATPGEFFGLKGYVRFAWTQGVTMAERAGEVLAVV